MEEDEKENKGKLCKGKHKKGRKKGLKRNENGK